jgi:hypothetical protein
MAAFGPLVVPWSPDTLAPSTLAALAVPLVDTVAECQTCGGRSPLPVGECETLCQWCGDEAWGALCALCLTPHPCEC